MEHKEQVRLTAQREKDYNLITDLVVESQTFVRNREGDPSSVSLRDVRRFLFFANFFINMKKPYSDAILVNAVVVSLALVYYYRLSRFLFFFLFKESIFLMKFILFFNHFSHSFFFQGRTPKEFLDSNL